MAQAEKQITSCRSEPEFVEAVKPTSQTLQRAAGVFAYLGENELPRYFRLPQKSTGELNHRASVALKLFRGIL